jgi:hypothetical protein
MQVESSGPEHGNARALTPQEQDDLLAFLLTLYGDQQQTSMRSNLGPVSVQSSRREWQSRAQNRTQVPTISQSVRCGERACIGSRPCSTPEMWQ